MSIPWNKGKKLSDEHRKNLSLSHIGQSRKMTDEHKKKIGDANRGTKHTEESRKNMSIAHLGQKPHIHTEEQKQKIRDNRKGLCTGENSPRWKGGIWANNTKAYYAFKGLERIARKKNAEGNHTLGKWETLKAQYNWTCPHCFKKEPDTKLTQDHIIPLSKGGSDNIENIQPLCGSCNSKKGSKL